MSRTYDMSVKIAAYYPARIKKIKAAARKEWPFQDWSDGEEGVTATAMSTLSGGEREEEFTERLSVAIWKANGAYCTVTVDAAYLDIPPPCETHRLDEADYKRLIGR